DLRVAGAPPSWLIRNLLRSRDPPKSCRRPMAQPRHGPTRRPRSSPLLETSLRNPAPNSCVGVIRGLDAVYTNVYRSLSASNGTRKRGGAISTSDEYYLVVYTWRGD